MPSQVLLFKLHRATPSNNNFHLQQNAIFEDQFIFQQLSNTDFPIIKLDNYDSLSLHLGNVFGRY